MRNILKEYLGLFIPFVIQKSVLPVSGSHRICGLLASLNLLKSMLLASATPGTNSGRPKKRSSLTSKYAFQFPLIKMGIFFLLMGCSGLEHTEREKLRRQNCKADPICRQDKDQFYPLVLPAHTPRALYPWESETKLPRLTKEFFRCKGNPLNPPIMDFTDPLKPVSCTDCEGNTRHGLPIIQGKENVYPILIELLNFLQKKTGKRVVITCGHRCPAHNTYANPSKENRTSKHQIGAEVDFYVQGMEERSLEIVGLLMQYYQENPLYQNDKEFLDFKRLEKSELAVQPWQNKEICIKIFQKHEGRDGDNRHPHAYISIQVRYDLDKKERVVYEWERAHKGYPH